VPFLRLTKPGFICVSLVVKGVIDRFRAALLLLLIASVMIARAIAARSDGRPSFYCQGQVSKRGEFLPVIKFLSMVLNTDQPRSELAKYTKFAGRLFKLGRPEDDRGRQIPAQVLG